MRFPLVIYTGLKPVFGVHKVRIHSLVPSNPFLLAITDLGGVCVIGQVVQIELSADELLAVDRISTGWLIGVGDGENERRYHGQLVTTTEQPRSDTTGLPRLTASDQSLESIDLHRRAAGSVASLMFSAIEFESVLSALSSASSSPNRSLMPSPPAHP